jgi:hypothetical protein
MDAGQTKEESVTARLARWVCIADAHAQEDGAYKLYPGDWAALGSVLRKAFQALAVQKQSPEA